MNARWRSLLTPLRSFRRLPAKYLPLAGMLIGLIGGGIYWLTVQLWPSSIAVILSLSAMAALDHGLRENPASTSQLLPGVFILFVKFNTLMALTTAELPFTLPANFALGFIMICGQSAARGLSVAVPAPRAEPQRLSNGGVALALALGIAPATLLGIPGLIGLAAAIVVRLGGTAYTNRGSDGFRPTMNTVQQLIEAAFYLGALATWKYI